MLIAKELFDTIVDTKKFFVTIKTTFILHNYVNTAGKSQILLRVSCNGTERIPIGIYVCRKDWLPTKQEVKPITAEHHDVNLLINKEKTKINDLLIFYRLSNKQPTLNGFIDDYKNDLGFGNFLKFFIETLKSRRPTIENSTYDKELAIYNKLKDFRKSINFSDIDHKFFFDFRNHLASIGNRATTRNGNIKIIKKYLRFAVKFGIPLNIDLDDIKSGSTKGDKIYLNANEVKKLHDYYYSSFIPNNHKLAVGYFLTSCFTGLRISDILQQKRHHLLKGYFHFTHIKTKKTQNMEMNNKALSIIKHCPDLFIKFYSKKHTRELVQQICKFLDIQKHVDYHTSRHTFGTNCVLVGIPVSKLQILMNHSDLKETQVYLHLAELEKNAKADLLDNLF